MKSAVVDVHNHFVPATFIDYVEGHGERLATEIVTDAGGNRSFLIQGTARRPMGPLVTSLTARRARMDAAGIDVQVLSCFPFMMYYEVPAALGLEVARLVNDGLAAAVESDPEHFLALATIPLQDPEAAARELERAVGELGLRGAQVLAGAPGVSLDGAALRPFWEAAARLCVPVLVHPFEARPTGDLARHQLGNLLGNPFATALAAALLILSGLLDELPGLRPLLAHGGGALPSVIGRLDRGWEGSRRPGGLGPVGSGLERPPSAYLDRFHYDTITFSARSLRNLVELVGAGRVVLGTDHPAPMELTDPLALVDAAGLDEEARAAVLGGSARDLFGLAGARVP